MLSKNIAVPEAVYERVQQVAVAEGTTVDQLATKAIERDLARRWLDRVGREGDLRCRDMSAGIHFCSATPIRPEIVVHRVSPKSHQPNVPCGIRNPMCTSTNTAASVLP